ncbi:MAG: hypothetical protein WC809_09930 [Sinimarinibacterium sp.]|jgi:hypothetical protein
MKNLCGEAPPSLANNRSLRMPFSAWQRIFSPRHNGMLSVRGPDLVAVRIELTRAARCVWSVIAVTDGLIIVGGFRRDALGFFITARPNDSLKDDVIVFDGFH